jgi:hypothetical protein
MDEGGTSNMTREEVYSIIGTPYAFYQANPDLARELLADPIRYFEYAEEYKAAKAVLRDIEVKE